MNTENEKGRGGEASLDMSPRLLVPASVASVIERVRQLVSSGLDGEQLSLRFADGDPMVDTRSACAEALSQISEVLNAYVKTVPIRPWTKAEISVAQRPDRPIYERGG